MTYAESVFWSELFGLRLAIYDFCQRAAAECMLCGHGEELE